MVTMLIESSPTSLDPRIGTDAQAEHIDSLIFDSLVRRDEHFNVTPWLAASWDTPDPLTYVFHLRSGVRFHDGQPLTSRDVKWTLDSILDGTVMSIKASSYATLASVEAPDPLTLTIHLKKPDPALLWNLCDGAFGVVPYRSGRDFGMHPIGSGPFRFTSQEQDKEVVIDRNPDSWQPQPRIGRVRFSVAPDAITRALELQKGSADVAVNALTADMYYALRDNKQLQVDSIPGTVLNYIAFNARDPILRDARVRQAIAFAIDRPLIVHSVWHDHARLSESLLPMLHWAFNPETTRHPFDPSRAEALLDDAGFHPDKNGVRFHLAFKTSTDETARLLAVILQQQLRQVGIVLDIRSFEFAAFYSDITKGAFQMYTLRWLGANETPDIFHYAYATESFPPHGANRGYYSNALFDKLLADASETADPEKRRSDYMEVQQILASDLPTINLWYLDTVIVHSRRLQGIHLSASGNFDFLRTATVER
jgi:peptide/nickel transport system substrate-binding protein